jgi:RecB family exonuclease
VRFNQHSDMAGKHALLSPSVSSWLNYDDQKLDARYYAAKASARGTALHKLAHDAIDLGVHIAHEHSAITDYVADGIEYQMQCEVLLFYSEYAFGTADTIKYDEENCHLRIHDLKTGISPSYARQLEVYAALFCLEYMIDPFTITMDLRIYQREEVKLFDTPPEVIETIMDKIIYADSRYQQLREGR